MARKHPISPHQIVLWAHHTLSPAWAPSRKIHPPQQGTTNDDQARNEQPLRSMRAAAVANCQPAATVLTRSSGVCAQVSERRLRRAGGRGNHRRPHRPFNDLV